jgi:hypothetical protein
MGNFMGGTSILSFAAEVLASFLMINGPYSNQSTGIGATPWSGKTGCDPLAAFIVMGDHFRAAMPLYAAS